MTLFYKKAESVRECENFSIWAYCLSVDFEMKTKTEQECNKH